MKTRGLCLFMLSLAAPMAQASVQLHTMDLTKRLTLGDQNFTRFAGGGDLSLSNILLNAANIDLSAGSIYLGGRVTIDSTGADDNTGNTALNTPPIKTPQGGSIDLSATPLLDITTLRPGADLSVSIVDKLSIMAGRDIILLPERLLPGGEIVIQSGGALMILGTTLTVPVPTAFSQLLLGLMAFVTPAIRRKKAVAGLNIGNVA